MAACEQWPCLPPLAARAHTTGMCVRPRNLLTHTRTYAQSAEHCSRLVAPGCRPYFSAPSLMETQVADRHNNQRGGAKNTTIEHTHTHTPVSLLTKQLLQSIHHGPESQYIQTAPETMRDTPPSASHGHILLAGLSSMVQSSPACLHNLVRGEAAEQNYVDS